MKRNANWIFYPSDFEIVLANKCMTKRYERDIFIPPHWRMDDCYHNVKFLRKFTLSRTNNITIKCEGIMNIQLNGKYVYNFSNPLKLAPGEYNILISVYNFNGLPSIYVEGEEISSDTEWLVTCNDNRYLKALSSDLIYGNSTPNNVKLPIEERLVKSVIEVEGKEVLDFGQEIMAYLRLEGIEGNGEIFISYGESLKEALDLKYSETCDWINITNEETYITSNLKAFRYIVIDSKTVKVSKVVALYEYLPVNNSNFKCSNQRINEIYDVSLHTLHLNTREFMLDGIKRDRWVWSGDAIQSYLMNYYSFFDKSVIKRTMIALFGKPPFSSHINLIMDYSFYWIISFWDYYLYTGDTDFIHDNFDKLLQVIDFCISRKNKNGLMEGLSGEWVFIDWANLDNTGEVCIVQMLFYYSIDIVIRLGSIINKDDLVQKYKSIRHELKDKIEKFWNPELGGYIHSFKDSKPDNVITKHANMFALLFDLCDESKKQEIVNKVLLNPQVPEITTPYMRFYELSALCKVGEFDFVYQEVLDYWGGMLDEGATTFWETYDKDEKGPEKYSMYGIKYGKSLCHAWGASPLYLLGRYFIGLRPAKPGYSEFEIKPHLSKMDWFDVRVPVNNSWIEFYYSKKELRIYSETTPGKIILSGNFEVVGSESMYQNNETIIFIEKAIRYNLFITPIY